jgi:hypothetical protein
LADLNALILYFIFYKRKANLLFIFLLLEPYLFGCFCFFISPYLFFRLAAFAVDALGQLKADEATGLLLFQALTGKCWAKVRDRAILVLEEIGNPQRLEYIIQSLAKYTTF